MAQLLIGIVIVGGPGLVVGAGLSAAVPRWRVLVALTVVVALGLLSASRQVNSGGDGEELIFLVALAANFAGWIAGLAIGTATARYSSRGAR